MDVGDALRRWYDFNARLFGKIHRFADVVAGLAFLVVLALGTSLAQAWFDVSIPLVPGPTRATAVAMYGAVGLFVVAVLVQTLAGLRSFFSRVVARVLESPDGGALPHRTGNRILSWGNY